MTPDFQNELLKVLQGINEDLSTLVDQMPSRRDMLAGMAMQGIMSKLGNLRRSERCGGFAGYGTSIAREVADALLTELDKKTSGFDFPVAKNESEMPE